MLKTRPERVNCDFFFQQQASATVESQGSDFKQKSPINDRALSKFILYLTENIPAEVLISFRQRGPRKSLPCKVLWGKGGMTKWYEKSPAIWLGFLNGMKSIPTW